MSHIDRREFLRRAVLAGTATPFVLASSAIAQPGAETTVAPTERLNIGVIGPEGRGAANRRAVAGENVVALCDIDSSRLASAAKEHPKAATFKDFRKLLEVKNLDAVVVSTPDHMHAIPAVRAMNRGLHVYCEKPLAHSVWEVRQMREAAKKNHCITQMGTQIHAGDNYRRAVEIVKSGILGDIRRVHVWMGGRPDIRGAGGKGVRVKEAKVPAHIDYDLWTGPAPMRPYHASHHHFNWRYWWDFGGGVLGDFGCHFMDLPHWALDLRAPTVVAAKGKKTYAGDNQVPDLLQVDYDYPARGKLPPVHLTWYHGGWKPEGAEVYGKGSAVLFEGENGRLISDYGSRKLFVDSEVEEELAEKIEPIPNSIGHHAEWINAIKTEGETTCNFDYSGALAESVLLGNVSYRCSKKLEWDDKALQVKNAPEAMRYVRRAYREGWTLEG